MAKFLIFNNYYNFAADIFIMKQLLLKQKQILFFIVAGGMSAVIEIGTFKLLSMYLPRLVGWEEDLYGIHFPLSNILSTACGIISNYFFSIWFVFERGKHSKRREFAYFMGVSAVSTLLSLFFFQVFYNFVFKNEAFDLGFFVFSDEILSKISAILVVSILNYSIKKRMIFNG